MIQIEASEMTELKEMFHQNSQYLQSKLSEINMTLEGSARVEKYVKILYTILTPFFSG